MAIKQLTAIALLMIAAFFATDSTAQGHKKSPTYKPGQVFRDCPNCPEMVVIPAGSFLMGSPDNEAGRSSDPNRGPVEGPQRLVHVPQFSAGKFDITKEQWALFVKATNRSAGGNCGWANLPGQDSAQPWLPVPAANWNHVGFAQDSTHPVVCISWTDAQDYAGWLSKKTGFTYRLLSEAEWEYAARAGTTTPYYWGTTASHEYANYGTDTVNGIGFIFGSDQWLYTSPVGSFPPNAFGLYDMSGNVWQWVDDCYSATYSGLPTDGSAYKKNMLLDSTGKFDWMVLKNACSFHIVRGGSAADSPMLLRVAFRNWGGIPGAMAPDLSRTAGGGFRVARTL
ncbi:MAG: formylglycine-generating enzyme family protein [Sphingobacteriales bacterium]|nr:MAG: formylglycine-generating enzyme family protein [Sphingobacteriales bacterium]